MSQESALKVLHELTAAGLLSSDAVTRFSTEIESGTEALLEKLIAEEVITPWQAEKFRAGLASDIFLGEYLVLRELGRGGMGTVLLARHRRMDREVAIKVLPVTAMESESAVARFFQEVKVAAKLIHPNIVHAYDAGEHKGFHYLVMEYVEGHDLAHVVHEIGPLPLSMALDYIRQAAVGLKWAHGEKNVIHRDIKPSNLLLDSRGNIKILDMGLARGAGASSLDGKSIHLTTTGQVMGTVEFMSPEQAEDTRLADERSDIYSLGCTLFRLLSNVGPFSRDTVVKTILAHRNDPIPQLPGNGDPLQPAAQQIFAKMVAKDPADRYQNLEDVIDDIDRVEELALEEPVMQLADEDVVEVATPVMNVATPSTAKATPVPITAVGVRIADDGSMTDLPSAVGEVLDLTGNESAHIAPPSLTSPSLPSSNRYSEPTTYSTPSQQDVFRISDDKPSRGVRLAIASFLSLLLSAIPTGIPVLIAGPLVWWFAWRQQKQIVKGQRRFERLQLTRWSKYAALLATAIGMIQFLVFFAP
jgi:serine/threonine protein kinase